MIGKSYKRDGQAIAHKTNEYQIGLTLVNWRKLDTTDEQKNIEGAHGIKMSPTYSRGRKIDIEGIIIADTRDATSKAMDWLDRAFGLQTTITDIPEKKLFTVVDEQDRERKIWCKIKDPIDYNIQEDDYMDGTTRSFRVSLQADDARFFSVQEQMVEGKEGVYGGFKLGVKLGKAMNMYFNEVECLGSGNVGNPARIQIIAKGQINSPLTIRKKGGEFFGIEVNAEAGDIIEVNAEAKTITKNGVNISEKRMPGSSWPMIFGTTIFFLQDKDGGLYESDFDVKIYFSNVLL
ncbi:MAG: phage tail family protein [candidate division SR1 bacterium]|nr:phage tail family protein [candidate division SR1 bacterium]